MSGAMPAAAVCGRVTIPRPQGFGLFLFLGVFTTMAGLFSLFAIRSLFHVASSALHHFLNR